MPARHTSRLRHQPWTIRAADAGDTPTIRRLAGLDSQPELTGPVLIAEVGDEPWAAVELHSGRTVADPFRPSAQIAELARARANLGLAA
jgi:hypothetical protein